jgi:hypothetical protein
VLIIQVAAALLLLLGSGLIFRALVEIDAPSAPRRIAHHRLRRYEPHSQPDESDLRRAA